MRALILGLAVGASCFGQKPVTPVQVSGGVMASHLLKRVRPVFPQGAWEHRTSGAFALHAVIGTDGLVKELRMLRGDESLRASVLDAVKQWTYKPYLVDGVAVAVDTTITLDID
jgi:protein TonB